MNAVAAVSLLVAASLLGLLVIPLGLPGLWIIVLGVAGYGWWTDFQTVPAGAIAVAVALAALGEAGEAWVGFRFAQRYGASRRAGWGALGGGLIGALIGVPLPVIGSVVGGFVGAFAGAALLEYTAARRAGAAARAGWGAALGRAAAAALKMAIGVVIAAGALWLAVRH